MIKKLFIILSVTFILSNFYGKEKTQDILTHDVWLIDFYSNPVDMFYGYYELKFSKDESISIQFIDRSSSYEEIGKYKIENNKIIITFKNENNLFHELIYNIFKNSKIEFELHENETIKYKYILKSTDNIIFNRTSAEVKANEIVNIKMKTGNYAVIILNPLEYESIADINMREEPNIKSQKVFKVDSKNSWIRKLIINNKSALRKGSKINIIARTVNKYKIDGIEDFWYLTDMPSDDNGNPELLVLENLKNEDDYRSIVFNAWIFGGYLKNIK